VKWEVTHVLEAKTFRIKCQKNYQYHLSSYVIYIKFLQAIQGSRGNFLRTSLVTNIFGTNIAQGL